MNRYLIATRSLCASLRCLARSLSRTILNPLDYSPAVPLSMAHPKAVIILSTPSQLSSVIREAFTLYEKSGLQTIVAGIDTVGPGSVRDGVLEMWLDEPVSVSGSTLLSERDDEQHEPRESDGVNIVVARKNWTKIDGSLSVLFNETCNAEISLANTAFHSSHLVTLFYLDAKDQNSPTFHSGKALCDLKLKIPPNTVAVKRIETRDKWTLLHTNDKPLIITGCVGNLIKTVNNDSAAAILESNDKLMSIGSKDTLVFVKVWHQNSSEAFKYEVIAGGGGWGAKANIIALSPEAKVNKGDRVEFYMLTPSDRFENDMPNVEDRACIILESSFEEQDYCDGTLNTVEVKREGIFSGGSEGGFTFNGVRYCSPGEQVVIQI